VTNADAKGALIGGAALSPDGRTLFALGDTGIVVMDVGTLKVRSRILTGDVIESIRFSADGHWLYAAGGAGGIWQINPATGAVAGQVKGGSATWALLWAEAK
jgi:WD40 repeat protein